MVAVRDRELHRVVAGIERDAGRELQGRRLSWNDRTQGTVSSTPLDDAVVPVGDDKAEDDGLLRRVIGADFHVIISWMFLSPPARIENVATRIGSAAIGSVS
jgi:hypothetical protein